MEKKAIAVALPDPSDTGWGVAGKYITEELQKLAMVFDLRGTELTTYDTPVKLNIPLLQPITGANLMPTYPHISGSKNIGYCFIEDDILMGRYILNAYWNFDHIICGSTWAAETMKAALGKADYRMDSVEVSTAIQGVDSDVFYPSRETKKNDKFTIWSGGKWEYRKGQDIVIAALQKFMAKHHDVHLVTSWWNPWSSSIMTMAENSTLISSDATGGTTAAKRYLDPLRVTNLDHLPYGASVSYIHQCDIGIFLSRCEAGTNLPLMEALACGLPVIATPETGHIDLVGRFAFYPKCDPVIFKKKFHDKEVEMGHWYEARVDSVIGCLEDAYSLWKKGNLMSLEGFIGSPEASPQLPTWEGCAKSILEVI